MRYYSPQFKESILRRVFASNPESVAYISRSTGIPKTTIFSWKYKEKMLLTKVKEKSNLKNWDGARKFLALLQTANMTEEEKSSYCREHGLYLNDLEQWRATAIASNELPSKAFNKAERAALRFEKKKTKELQRELARKEKALAEAAALLILKKKVQALYEDHEGE